MRNQPFLRLKSPFFCILSYPEFTIWATFILLFANALNLVESKILSFGKELSASLPEHISFTHYQTTNFRLFQTERVCRQQFQFWRKWQKSIQTPRKHCGKRRHCSLPAISPFPMVFSKGLFPMDVKRCHCVGMG